MTTRGSSSVDQRLQRAVAPVDGHGRSQRTPSSVNSHQRGSGATMRWGRAGIGLVVVANIVFIAQMVRHAAVPKPPARKAATTAVGGRERRAATRPRAAAAASRSRGRARRADVALHAATSTRGLSYLFCQLHAAPDLVPHLLGPGYDKNAPPVSATTPLRSRRRSPRRRSRRGCRSRRCRSPTWRSRPARAGMRPSRQPRVPPPRRHDALLLSWRLNAPGFRSAWKLSKLRLMGWEHTGGELRGHSATG